MRRCTCCQRLQRGSHPDLPHDQCGATAHRLGDGVYALAHWLHYGRGLPVRRLPALFWEMLRIPLTQGALTQDALRRVGETRNLPTASAPADPLAPLPPPEQSAATGPIGYLYLLLRWAIARERVVHTDDTSWWIWGTMAWLMVFSSCRLVVYQIRYHHRNTEVLEVLQRFFGILVCDPGPSYEARSLQAFQQQKCLSHLIRNIRAVLEYLEGDDFRQAAQLLELLQEALALWRAFRADQNHDYAEQAAKLVQEVDKLLEPVTHQNPFLNTLLNGIGRQHDKGHLLRFLGNPEIEPTNNRAERDLRPAVVARKVSQCSKSDPGAEAHAAWCSVIATLYRLRTAEMVPAILQCMRTGTIPGLELPAPGTPGSLAASLIRRQ